MILGIDVGAKGGIAVIGDNIIDVRPFSANNLIEITEKYFARISCALVESVHSMPNQGVASTFSFGRNFGYILGVLDKSKIPIYLIPPNTWKRHYMLSQDKQLSINKAHELFPDVSLRRTERCRVDHDGMAEALLIAQFWNERGEAHCQKYLWNSLNV